MALPQNTIAIIGAGPAGLFAAEKLAEQGYNVTVYDRKPSVARKFLMAGRGGLNLTHSEDITKFMDRYGAQKEVIAPLIEKFPPDALRQWCEKLGQETFIGTSGRVFPKSLKASPLLRSWISRLESYGVIFKPNHDWLGWNDASLVFDTPDGQIAIRPDATLFALGGASWPKLGSNGAWVKPFRDKGIDVAAFEPSNCGFTIKWSDIFREKYAGAPLKAITIKHQQNIVNGEMMISDHGVEGGGIYALSQHLRENINKNGSARIEIDLKPDLGNSAIVERLSKPRGKLSFSNYLKKYLNLSPVAIGLLMENQDREWLGRAKPQELVTLIKALPLILNAPFSIDRAISSAGGVKFESLNENLMLIHQPGAFVAGEMLDWEAPTGGYLLQACFATGLHAAEGIMQYLNDRDTNHG